MMYGNLSVHELYVNEIPNFFLKSINNFERSTASEKFLNNLFVVSNSSRNTRSCCTNLLKYNARKVKLQRYSIHSRCVNLFDTLQHNNFFINDVCPLNREQLGNFLRRVRSRFILGNNELVKCVFEILRSLFVCRINRDSI